MADAVRWRLEAPAKLNLDLRVVGLRPDGFHQLESTLVLLELADLVQVDPTRPDLSVVGPAAAGVPGDAGNLAWRGWQAGWGVDAAPAGLLLEKHVPAASGLGGGSSDAAAAWRLARYARAAETGQEDPATASDMADLATIGADVPFFAARVAAARVSGIGERVDPLDTVPISPEVVLVHPPFTLSTAAVFAELRAADWNTGQRLDLLTDVPGSNDLLSPARRLRPELDDVFRTVSAAGGEPHLTGSGPTVFAMTTDPERAAAIAVGVERAGLAATRTRLRTEPASIER